ncbi:CDK-activating kinase assembly factor like [Heracleum sosnowskyi]|uniref:CDK-activating kinase assembly factor like n=1 Tax=Heracleum sosnowskyi TaxID=360622 RepID=A0AAD8HI36_9APIA|nr:CDK-activating kinase assembly factor like [Heracleum sosnowskyi]
MVVVAAGTTTFAKEMAIRKRISNIFNKREDDFPSLREYNDYLEEVEDMIVNMVEGIDVPAIEARITQYQRENSEQIMNAQARKAEEYAAALAASRGQPVHSEVDATAGQSSQATSGTGGHYVPAVAGGTIGQPIPIGSGHEMLGYQFDDEEMMKLKAKNGGKAGGWSIELSKKRALEEAFGSIWI